MKENIARIAIATTISLGAWFAGNCEYVKDVPKNTGSSIAGSTKVPAIESTEGSLSQEPRTPEIVARINSAIAFLEACPNDSAKEAAAKFIALNKDAKITIAYGNEIGKNALGVIVTTGDEVNFIPQIGIAPQTLLDQQISNQEVGIQMFKAVYISEAIKNSPERYDKDQDFRNLINNQADQHAGGLFCAK